MTDAGITSMARLPWGSHVCHFYDDRADLLKLLVPYFKAGLEHNDYCMWATTSPVRQSDAFNALFDSLPDVERHLRSGQLEILDYRNWYLRDGLLDAERVLEGWQSKAAYARKRGFDGLRVTGNPVWLDNPAEWSHFLDYEALVDEGLLGSRIIALCTYYMQKCSASDIIRVMKHHGSTVCLTSQGWELVP